MSRKKINSSSVDFQSEDEAWYPVRLVLQGETLIVKYCDFPNEYNDRYKAEGFKDSKELEGFTKRFRPTPIQLQDNQCQEVVEGMTICASYVDGNDVKYYDAVVESVTFKNHKFENEEVCTCTFGIIWLHGQKTAGNRAEIVAAHICLLQPERAPEDPTLSCFLKISREKLKVDFGRSGSSYDQDTNLGGTSGLVEDLSETPSYHFILIENLEKDLSPLTIMDFVKKHVSITSQAQVFPSLSMESFTRGIIAVESQGELQKLYDFIDNPAHMIISSRGKPWVVTEKKLRCGASNGKLTMLSEIWPCNKTFKNADKLRIVRRESEEYMKGKQLRSLFLEFADHLRGLHKQFALEASDFLVMSDVP
ncbi:Sawadee domain containing protein [Thalictrum thalictroides]|uniref:Sawadee domain containing protein n=1 Tax=Thalictrum thalictroides TaxID=46969 RepID=A0A7J6X787_THATH|nr:Sawadee domain containing protein [Thalictrum thalictroides]